MRIVFTSRRLTAGTPTPHICPDFAPFAPTTQNSFPSSAKKCGLYEGSQPMEQAHPPPQLHDKQDPRPLPCVIDEAGVRALIEENTQLRQLVIYLSKLAIKRVVGHG